MSDGEITRLVDALESQLSSLHMALFGPAILSTLTGKTDPAKSATFALCSQCFDTLQELKNVMKGSNKHV